MSKVAYRVVTPRLVLRCWEPRDAALLKTAVDESLQHLQDMPWSVHEPQTLDQKIELLRGFRAQFDCDEDYVYGIFDLTEQRVLGGTGLHARHEEGAREIGYWIHTDHTDKGLATEAAAAMTRVGFELLGLDRVEIHCAPANARSARVAKKLGYAHEATLKRRLPLKGNKRDTMVWSLFADGYPQSPAKSQPIEAFDAARRKLL
jgi:RimJ/RimL family protein N-acetyltransferase